MKESGTNIASSFRYVTARRRCRGRSAISKPRASRFGERSRKGGQAMTGKIARPSVLGASCVGILLGAAPPLWTPVAGGAAAPRGRQAEPRSLARRLAALAKEGRAHAQDGTAAS